MKLTVIEECFLKTSADVREDNIEVVAAMIISVPLSLMTILGNCSMLVVFAKSRSLRSHSNILLGFLCLFDLLVGLTAHPLLISVLAIEDDSVSQALVSVFLYLVSLLDGFSVIAITCIALERFIAICFPFLFEKFASKRLNIAVMLLLNAAWLLLSFLFFVHEIFLLYVCVALEFVIFLTVSVCYIYIYVIIKKKRTHVIVLGTILNSNSVAVTSRRKEGKKSKTVAILLIFFYVCFLPSYVYLVQLLIKGRCDDELHSSLWLLLPTLANSAGNPLVYYISRAEIRGEMKRILRGQSTTVSNPET